MALVVSSPRSSFRKAAAGGASGGGTLSDYLRDDMSSCSSNGFRSFPRRQCCIAVRNLIEAEVRGRTSTSTTRNATTTTSTSSSKMIAKKRPRGRRPKYSSATTCVPKLISSRLHRASTAVIKAVKLLPSSFTSPSSVSKKKSPMMLPRSLSKKLVRIKSSFWTNIGGRSSRSMKEEVNERPCEIERWIYSGVASLSPNDDHHNYDLSISSKTTGSTSNNNTSTSDDHSAAGSKTDSWSESDFTIVCSSTTDQESFSAENDADDGAKEISSSTTYSHSPPLNHDQVSKNGAATPAATLVRESVQPGNTTTNFIIQEETRHSDHVDKHTQGFSPVSVLDFSTDHDTHGGISSPVSNRHSQLEGAKTKLMQRLQRFECLSRVDPVNLHNRISEVESSNEYTLDLSISSTSSLNFDNFNFSEEESEAEEREVQDHEEEEEKKVYDEEEEGIIDCTKQKTDNMLQLLQSKLSCRNINFEIDHLMQDFFMDNIVKEGGNRSDYLLVKNAEDWLNGHYDELLLGWEVKDKRQAYIRDMEEGGVWKSTDVCKEEVALQLEDEVFDSLIHELLLEL